MESITTLETGSTEMLENFNIVRYLRRFSDVNCSLLYGHIREVFTDDYNEYFDTLTSIPCPKKVKKEIVAFVDSIKERVWNIENLMINSNITKVYANVNVAKVELETIQTLAKNQFDIFMFKLVNQLKQETVTLVHTHCVKSKYVETCLNPIYYQLCKVHEIPLKTV